MEKINPKQAAGVWERVTAGREQKVSMEQLVLDSWENAMGFLHLSRRVQGNKGARLHSLYQGAQQSTDCLRGICLLLTGSRPTLGNKPPKQESVESGLRSCYGRAMRLLARLEENRTDSQYGAVFGRLAVQQQEQCRQILELLGSLEVQKGRK